MRTITVEEHFITPAFLAGPGKHFMNRFRDSGPAGAVIVDRLTDLGDKRVAVSKGDVLGAPAGGPETAHQLINTGPAVLIYLAVSTKARTEIVEYPDSGKFLAKTYREDKTTFRVIGRAETTALDYWDGEAGASND